MSNKLEEALKRTIKDEFVHGFMDENGVRQYPTIMALAKRHDIPNVTLHRHSKKEDWQSEKNRVQTEYENAVAKERMAKMLAYGSRLDDNAINLALGIMGDAGRRISEDLQNRETLKQLSLLPEGSEKEQQISNFFLTTKILTTHDINSLGHAIANAQKVGKLALGQAQEISKVSANVELPKSLREVLDQLDELAEQKASGAQHTLQ